MKSHKIFLFAAAVLATLASCSDEENITVGEQDSTDKPFAYMDASNVLDYELDPADATEISFNVCRSNGISSAASIPLNVAVNTDNVFNVPATADFQAGEETTTVKVTFPNSEIGTTYTLKVGFTSDYAGIYKDAIREQAFTVTRVKWNTLSSDETPVYLYDDFWYGGYFNITLQQRDDDPTSYRFESPYTDDVTGGGGTYQQWINFNVSKKGVVSFDSFYFNTLYSEGAEIIAWWPTDLSSSATAYNEYSYCEYNEDGSISYVALAPWWYISGLGGWNPTNGYNLYIFFPGYDFGDGAKAKAMFKHQ